MTKSILKEIIIVLLLCLAIILVLGILLYDYVPISKTVPNQVAYTTPEDVKQELLQSGALDESEVIMTYEVNNEDLNNYRSVKDYKPGKANPFSSYETPVIENTTNSTNGTSTTGSASSSDSTTGSASSDETTSNSGGGSQTTSESGSSTSTGERTSSTTSENTTSGGHFFQDKGTK